MVVQHQQLYLAVVLPAVHHVVHQQSSSLSLSAAVMLVLPALVIDVVVHQESLVEVVLNQHYLPVPFGCTNS